MSGASQSPRGKVRGLGTTLGLGMLAAALLLASMVWHDAQDAWSEAGDERRVVVKLSIYWFLWLLWPLMAWLAVSTWRRWKSRRYFSMATTWLALLASTCVAWARFIEPNLLAVRETRLGTQCGVRVALVSDLHMGLYTRQGDLQRLVDRLNGLNVDAVLIAGDWTYEPSHDLAATLAPLAGLRHRSLSVLGNHDEERPGPPLAAALQAALTAAHVEPIDGRRVRLGQCELEGLGDLYARSARRHLKALNAQASPFDGDHRIVLTHNPDTAFLLEPNHAAWLLAGHTHGGQIDLPLLTERVLAGATDGGFRQGRYELKNTRVFVTSGVGVDKLPLRFRVRPTIDVLGL